jgi:hypothetical protein
MSDLFFVSCTRAAKEGTPLFGSLRALGCNDFHFFEHNRRGLPECYNEWLDRLAGQDVILVLVHDDVMLGDVFLHAKLQRELNPFDITGVVGSSYFDFSPATPHYAWDKLPAAHRSGAVEHPISGEQTLWFVFGPTPRRCVILDGVLLALDMRNIGGVRFDPQFSFHLYDLDFCLTAYQAHLALGTTSIPLRHLGKPQYLSAAYRQALGQFRQKWSGVGTRLAADGS